MTWHTDQGITWVGYVFLDGTDVTMPVYQQQMGLHQFDLVPDDWSDFLNMNCTHLKYYWMNIALTMNFKHLHAPILNPLTVAAVVPVMLNYVQ
jgi:hypothetical protein